MKNIKTFENFNQSRRDFIKTVGSAFMGFAIVRPDIKSKRVCAIFAHPDDELNIMAILKKQKIDKIFYLTPGQAGWRYSDYYGKPEEVRPNIVEIRKKETEEMSKYFEFKYEILNFEDINNQLKTPWDKSELNSTIQKLSSDYDIVYTIGLLDREHHQHKQICNSLMEICPEKVRYGNYWINVPSELGVKNYKSHIIERKDLTTFIDILKSQGTMKGAVEVTGNIIWNPNMQ
jgi:LmbE family N-acetylglucosaminyl deacetylase